MQFEPITSPEKTQDWVNWLEQQLPLLLEKENNPDDNRLFETPDGDVVTATDIVGHFLATLKNEVVVIEDIEE